MIAGYPTVTVIQDSHSNNNNKANNMSNPTLSNGVISHHEFVHFYNENIRWHKLGTKPEVWGTPQHINGCFKMVEEEVKELEKGYLEQNPVEVLDGLVDVFVTLCPLVEVSGFKFNSPGYQIGPRFTDLPVRKSIEMLKEVVHVGYTGDTGTALASLCSTMSYVNYPVREGMKEILYSNFTKYPTVTMLKDMYGDDVEAALQAASDDAETKYGYNNVVGTIVDGHCVFRTEGGLGKIAKNWNYKKPNLKQFFHPDELK